MPVRVAVPKEIFSGERRVALDPSVAERFTKLGADVLVQKGAGKAPIFNDDALMKARQRLVDDAKALYRRGRCRIQGSTAHSGRVGSHEGWHRSLLVSYGRTAIADMVHKLCDKKITSFAMELLPRISRAQSMDALSSQASIAGYKAALMAAELASCFFPMLTTAAGTIRPAKVLVVGAGVAGLQAIATCKRLGAMVEAYDVRCGRQGTGASRSGAKFDRYRRRAPRAWAVMRAN
ncbi:MAG: hypothetical protein MZV65_28400 [Chromatiales bacterium]|nr:hypothetical protein [Chromatiales bacterium]